MPGVTVKNSESIDDALRRFKRDCERSGLKGELKKRVHFESPSLKKKKKKEEAIKKKRRRASKAMGRSEARKIRR